MKKWNAVEVIYRGKPIAAASFQVDASTSYGAGAFYKGEGLSVKWQEEMKADINVLEVYAVLLAARKWGMKWRGRVVLVQSDNTTAVGALNKGHAKSPLVMQWLRELFMLSARGGFEVTAIHIPGIHNKLADYLSRGKWEEYSKARELWERVRAGERGEVWEANEWLRVMWENEEKGIQEYASKRGLQY